MAVELLNRRVAPGIEARPAGMHLTFDSLADAVAAELQQRRAEQRRRIWRRAARSSRVILQNAGRVGMIAFFIGCGALIAAIVNRGAPLLPPH